VRVGLWIGTVIAGAVSLWLLLAYGSANVDRVTTGFMGAHADFDTFHRSAQALLHGRPIYDTGAALVNLNPPVWTILFAPFGLLDVCFVLVGYWLALSAVQDDRDDPGEVREPGDLGRAEHRPARAANQ